MDNPAEGMMAEGEALAKIGAALKDYAPHKQASLLASAASHLGMYEQAKMLLDSAQYLREKEEEESADAGGGE